MSPALIAADRELSAVLDAVSAPETRDAAQAALQQLEIFLETSGFPALATYEQASLLRRIAKTQRQFAVRFQEAPFFNLAFASLQRAQKLAAPEDRLDDYLQELAWCPERYGISHRSEDVDWAVARGNIVMFLLGASEAWIPGHLRPGLSRPIEELDIEAVLTCCTSVAAALYLRYETEDAGEDLDLAILWRTTAVRPERFNFYPLRDNAIDLALWHLERYDRFRRYFDADSAVNLARRAVTEIPDEDGPRSRDQCVLASALLSRHEAGGPLEDLNDAIRIAGAIDPGAVRGRVAARAVLAKGELLQRLQAVPDDAPPSELVSAGVHWLNRSEQTGDSAELDRAIGLLARAYALPPVGEPANAGYPLASALLRRSRLAPSSEDRARALEIAIALCAAAAPDSAELADAQLLRANCLVDVKASPGGWIIQMKAESPDDRGRLNEAAEAYRAAVETGVRANPRAAIEAAAGWAEISVFFNRNARAATAWTLALAAYYRILARRPSQAELLGTLYRLPFIVSRAAFYLARVGDVAGAIVVLEKGRRVLGYGGDSGTSGPEDWTGDLVEYARKIADLFEREYDDGSDFSWSLAGSASALIRTMWEHQKASGWLAAGVRASTLEMVARACGNAVVVYVIPGPYFLAIGVDAAGDVRAELTPGGSENEVRRRFTSLYAAFDARRRYTDAFEATLSTVCEWMGQALLPAISNVMLENRYALVVPVGLLSLLPLASCSFQGRDGKTHYGIDAMSLSFAPSAGAIAEARKQLANSFSKAAVIVESPEPTRYRRLELAGLERAVAAAFHPVHRVLSGVHANRSEMGSAMLDSSVLHVASHGLTLRDNVDGGGLILAGDELLTVREIAGLKLEHPPRLAVLSACESASTAAGIPDESAGFPLALMGAGIPGVVGTLWAISEVDALFVTLAFYRNWRTGGMEPVDALREAQRWLRDSTNQQKLDELSRVLPDEDKKTPEFQKLAGLLTSAPQARDFSHPSHWAPFVFNGV